ncbi:MAG: pilin [Clostridia bacterium]|nr:pilin [Clostridia bacterium]
MGFKTYGKLIFNANSSNDSLSPFSGFQWNTIMQWYRVFSVISGSLIFLAVIILSYKVIISGTNSAKRNEAKDSLSRLLFGGVAIAVAPTFVRLLLFLNNAFVSLLMRLTTGNNIDSYLGNEVFSNIETGNPIVTALVISMFIYLFVKLNIKFIIREFTIITFTIFTPVVAGLWIINRNVTAASIWAGQIMINIFMQFIYCFLFLLYMSFLPVASGWAVQLIWAMMILPLADVLMNCLQNLTSRIAGLDSNEMTGRALGMGTAFGYSLSAIKNQFTTPKNNNDTTGGASNSQGTSFLGRVKNFINPQMNLSQEKDYNGNNNPIRTVIPKEKSAPTNPVVNNNKVINTNDKKTPSSVVGSIAKAGFTATKSYLSVGAKMAEGNFNTNQYRNINNNKNNSYDVKNNISKTVEITKNVDSKIGNEKSDVNES